MCGADCCMKEHFILTFLVLYYNINQNITGTNSAFKLTRQLHCVQQANNVNNHVGTVKLIFFPSTQKPTSCRPAARQSVTSVSRAMASAAVTWPHPSTSWTARATAAEVSGVSPKTQQQQQQQRGSRLCTVTLTLLCLVHRRQLVLWSRHAHHEEQQQQWGSVARWPPQLGGLRGEQRGGGTEEMETVVAFRDDTSRLQACWKNSKTPAGVFKFASHACF